SLREQDKFHAFSFPAGPFRFLLSALFAGRSSACIGGRSGRPLPVGLDDRQCKRASLAPRIAASRLADISRLVAISPTPLHVHYPNDPTDSIHAYGETCL